jgi:phosphoglucomutase
MMKFFRENIPTNVAGAKVNKVIDYINGYEDIPPQNAIRLFLDNGSWFAVRPSGTEPKIKFYFYSNRNSREEALKVNADIKKEILDLLSSVE